MLALGAVAVLALTGCSSLTIPGQTPEPSLVPPTGPAPSPTQSHVLVTDEIDLPRDCATLFDEDFIQMMEEGHAPLNDPGLSMSSTSLERGQALLATHEHLRCTWGVPSEVGMATTVMIVSNEKAQAVMEEAAGGDFLCGTISATERRCDFYETGASEMGGYSWGEEHVWRGNAWIATRWLNLDVPGYTDGIVAALWN